MIKPGKSVDLKYHITGSPPPKTGSRSKYPDMTFQLTLPSHSTLDSVSMSSSPLGHSKAVSPAYTYENNILLINGMNLNERKNIFLNIKVKVDECFGDRKKKYNLFKSQAEIYATGFTDICHLSIKSCKVGG